MTMYATGYHGTGARFNRFNLNVKTVSRESYFGEGVYLSSSYDDIFDNYTRSGIDREYKKLTIPFEAWKWSATDYILKVALTIKNPFYADEKIVKYTPELSGRKRAEFHQKMENRGWYQESSDKETMEELLLEPVLHNSFVRKIIQTIDLGDENYRYVGQFLKETLQLLGYDGVIQNASQYFSSMTMHVKDVSEVTHFVVFNPKQTKIFRRIPIKRFNRG